MKKVIVGVMGVLLAGVVGATQVISLNFGSNENAVSGDEGTHGLIAVPGTAWRDLSGGSGSATGATLYDIETGSTSATDELAVTWSGSGTWRWNSAKDNVQKGYIDDNGARVRIGVSNVPFQVVDVIVYFNSDNSGNKFTPTEINGVLWTWDAEEGGARLGASAADTWGATCQSGVMAFGTNVLRVNGVTVGDGGTVNVNTAERSTSRGSVAALQIVEAATAAETLPDPDFELTGQPGANPTGWLTSFSGEFKNTNLRVGPLGSDVMALGNGNTPYSGLQMPEAFTCAVLLDITDVATTGKDHTLLDFGNGGNGKNYLQLFKLAGYDSRVQLAYCHNNNGTCERQDTIEIDNVPQGYHLYTITFSTTAGMTLRLDDGEIRHGAMTSFAALAAGTQFGSLHGGRGSQCDAGDNCGLCLMRMWNGAADATRQKLIWDVYKGAVGTPVKYGYSSNLANGSTISIPTLTDTGVHYLGANGGTMNVMEPSVVNVAALMFLNASNSGNSFTFNLEGTVNVTGSSTTWNVYEQRGKQGILLGHWAGTGTYNIKGALVGEGAYLQTVYSAGQQTVNIDGGRVRVRGLLARNGNSAINVKNGGVLELAEIRTEAGAGVPINAAAGTLRAFSYDNSTGWTQPARTDNTVSFSDVATGTTIDPNGLKISFQGTTQGAGKVIVADSSAAGNGTVEFASLNAMTGPVVVKGAATLRAAVANGFNGTLDVQDTATLELGASRPEGAIAFAEGSTVVLRESLADEGGYVSLTFTGSPHVVMYRPDGTTRIDDAHVETVDGVSRIRYSASASPLVSGEGCWYDFEFENRSYASVGQNKGSLFREIDEGIGAVSGDEANDFLDDHALYTAAQCYMSITYPSQWSAAIYATVPQRANCTVMAFGTKDGGLIGLLAGTAENEVLLVRTTGDSHYEVLAAMTVPNAATSQHLYVFSKRSRTIDIYLDGVLWNSYTSPTDITLGSGFQIGSVHGSTGNTGLDRFGVTSFYSDKSQFAMDTAPAELLGSYIGMLRIYDTALNSTAMAALAAEFPYVSPNGLYTRTVAGADEAWSAADAWSRVTETGSTAVDAPAEGAMLQFDSSSDAAALTVGLSADAHFESLAFTGRALRLKKGAGGELMNDGKTTVNADVTIEYGAASIAGGPLVMGANGKVTFDFSAFPMDSGTPNRTIVLTGNSSADAAVAFIPPTKTFARTFTLAFNPETNQWQVSIKRLNDVMLILVH